MINLDDFRYYRLDINRSVSDPFWNLEMEIDGEDPAPDKWRDTFLQRGEHGLFLGEITSSEDVRTEEGEDHVMVSGYSKGYHLQRPLVKLDDRALKNTSGEVFEDPLLYLNRLVWPDGKNVCGVTKGYWESSVSGWGTDTCPYQPFEVTGPTITVQNQIDSISEETDLYHFDDWIFKDGIWQPVSYLTTLENLDINCNLPDMLVIDITEDEFDIFDNQLVRTFRKQDDQTKFYNRVYIEGLVDGDTEKRYGAYYPEKWDSTDIERIYPYEYQLPDGTTETKAKELVKAKAKKIYDLVGIPTLTYEFTFLEKFDLKFMQKIKFIGFPDIPSVELRVIEIQLSYDDQSGWVTGVSCSEDKNWAAARKIGYVFKSDWRSVKQNIKNMIDRVIAQKGKRSLVMAT